MPLSRRGILCSLPAIVFASLMIAGCKNNVGPTGPAGNANVKIDTFTVSGSQWHTGGVYQLYTDSLAGPASWTRWPTRFYDRMNSSITWTFLDTGLVLVYFIPSQIVSQWMQLPYHIPSTQAKFNYNFVSESCERKTRLHIFFSRIDPSAVLPDINTVNFPRYKFKVVVISGSFAKQVLRSGINLADHDAVMQYLDQ